METVYTFDNPQEVKVVLFMSDTQELSRYFGCRYLGKEKVFSSHINIFQPALKPLLRHDSHRLHQTIRPLLTYKRMKLPLGKIRVVYFKANKSRSA